MLIIESFDVKKLTRLLEQIFKPSLNNVNLETVCLHDADVSRYQVAKLDLDDVTDDEIFGMNVQLVAIAYDKCKLQRIQIQKCTRK